MPVGSKELLPAQLDELSNEDLADRLKQAKQELFNLRFQSATGQLDNHGRVRAVKRDIARIYTVARERELGIRQIPVASAPAAKKASKKKAKSEKAEEVDA